MNVVDDRFDQLLDGFTKHQELANKLRRMKKFLENAIEDAMSPYGNGTLLAPHVGKSARMPIGTSGHTGIEVRIARYEDQKKIEYVVKFRLFDGPDHEMSEGTISLTELELLAANPNGMIDVSAALCVKIGCYDRFAAEVHRFAPIEFKL